MLFESPCDPESRELVVVAVWGGLLRICNVIALPSVGANEGENI